MKQSLFEFPAYKYELDDWEFKKKALLNRINKHQFIRTQYQTFETDRQTNGKKYIHYLERFLEPTLQEFCTEAEVSCKITDAWGVKYHPGVYQGVHNHRSWGFSGILYVEFDPKVHTPASFVVPWNDPRSDRTSIMTPRDVKEGTLLITPSFALHYVNKNTSRKTRTAVAFDLLPDLPLHQTIGVNEKELHLTQ